jgi:hypothetical protein
MTPNLNRAVAPRTHDANPIAALAILLDELTDVLLATPHDVYSAAIEPHVSGTIGAHVRHVLDHVAALLTVEGGTLSYDRRERGTMVEVDSSAALRQILRLKSLLDRWHGRSLDEPILVRSILSGGDELSCWSSLGREAAFVLSHTIHHEALIAVLLAWHGETVPDRFGIAPSTPRA